MKFRHHAKRIFTAALVLWLSGIVVLFCCDMPAVEAASAEEVESCPLAKKAHCSKTAEVNAEHSFGQQPRAFDCCIFPTKIFDKARKLEKSPESATIPETVEIAAPNFSLIRKTFKSPKFYQSVIHNRGSTFLQNCVFRI